MPKLATQFPETSYLGRIPFVQTGFGSYPQTSFGLHVQMMWTVWFWHGCLGNESNDISIPDNVSAKTFTL